MTVKKILRQNWFFLLYKKGKNKLLLKCIFWQVYIIKEIEPPVNPSLQI